MTSEMKLRKAVFPCCLLHLTESKWTNGMSSLLNLALNCQLQCKSQLLCKLNNITMPLLFCIRQLRKRHKLDELVSMALGVPYNSKTGHIDILDKREYVMTLDYAVKMLAIHERRLCGVPVVIKGESGVGKTFLLETLSALWNHALLADLDLDRSRLKDDLRRDLSAFSLNIKHMDENKGKEFDVALKDISGGGEISTTTLTFILKEKSLYFTKYLPNLLSLRRKPVISILQLPKTDEMAEYESYVDLFNKAEARKKIKSKEVM